MQIVTAKSQPLTAPIRAIPSAQSSNFESIVKAQEPVHIDTARGTGIETFNARVVGRLDSVVGPYAAIMR